MLKKIKKLLVSVGKKHHWFLNTLRGLRNILRKIVYLYYFLVSKVDDKSIIFESFIGRQYSCSPKAIYLELINNPKYKDYKFIWAFKTPKDFKDLIKNKNTTIVKYGSSEYYKAYARSKYWVTNSRIPESIIRKKEQVYIQCWHGTPLKKLGFDIEVDGGNAMNSVKDIQKKYLTDSKKYTKKQTPK